MSLIGMKDVNGRGYCRLNTATGNFLSKTRNEIQREQTKRYWYDCDYCRGYLARPFCCLWCSLHPGYLYSADHWFANSQRGQFASSAFYSNRSREARHNSNFRYAECPTINFPQPFDSGVAILNFWVSSGLEGSVRTQNVFKKAHKSTQV